MRSRPLCSAIIAVTLLAAVTGSAHAGETYDAVKEKGFIQCGVSEGLPGFSNADEKGIYSGIDVDVCRGVAAAVFGDATKIRYTPLSTEDRFPALQTGKIDLLSRNTTWTSSREGARGINFTGVVYYDGQSFLVSRKLGVETATALDGAAVCVQTGTTTELNLSDYFRSNSMKYTAVTFANAEESVKAFEAGECDVLTSDQSQLYAQRIKLANPDDYVVLPEVISKEPLGPAVRQGDDEWFNIVKWTLFAMLNAEELGVTSQNIDEMKVNSGNPDVRRMLGTDGNMGKDLSLPKDWVVNIVKQVGNYGEIFDRNIGAGSALKIERGLNALWTKGGLHYGPPIR